MADQDCGILGIPAGTADALTPEFATASGARPVEPFSVGFSALTIEKAQRATTIGGRCSFDRDRLVS